MVLIMWDLVGLAWDKGFYLISFFSKLQQRYFGLYFKTMLYIKKIAESWTLTFQTKFFSFGSMIQKDKMLKKAFYFILKALFVLKIFLSGVFGHAEKRAWLER